MVENQSLDFSFCDLTDVISLKSKEPRAGKRKPIIGSEAEGEEKNKQDLSKTTKPMTTPKDMKAEEEKGSYANTDQKGKTVISSVRANQTPQVNTILQQHNVPLINNNDRTNRIGGNMDLVQLGTTGQKGEEGKKEGTKKKVVKKVCRTLLLNNNEIRSITGLFPTLELVMNAPAKLKWLDLSFNYLTHIDAQDILQFQELKTLYLHGNYIYQLDEIK